MTTHQNIAAWTAPELGLPPYVSINQLPNGNVSVTVRGKEGRTEEVIMNSTDWAHFKAMIGR